MKLYRYLVLVEPLAYSSRDADYRGHVLRIEEKFGIRLDDYSSWPTMVEDMKKYSLRYPNVRFVMLEAWTEYTFKNGELVPIVENDEEDEE